MILGTISFIAMLTYRLCKKKKKSRFRLISVACTFINLIAKTSSTTESRHIKVYFFVYGEQIFINDESNVGGSFASSVLNTTTTKLV